MSLLTILILFRINNTIILYTNITCYYWLCFLTAGTGTPQAAPFAPRSPRAGVFAAPRLENIPNPTAIALVRWAFHECLVDGKVMVVSNIWQSDDEAYEA